MNNQIHGRDVVPEINDHVARHGVLPADFEEDKDLAAEAQGLPGLSKKAEGLLKQRSTRNAPAQ